MKQIFIVATTYTKTLEEVGKFRQDHFAFIQKILMLENLSQEDVKIRQQEDLSWHIT